MAKPNPPVFHIPIGRYRRDGEVVMIEDADHAALMAEWQRLILEHPDTVRAGCCVTVGPTQTMLIDLSTRNAIVSRTAEDWVPSALSDLTARS